MDTNDNKIQTLARNESRIMQIAVAGFNFILMIVGAFISDGGTELYALLLNAYHCALAGGMFPDESIMLQQLLCDAIKTLNIEQAIEHQLKDAEDTAKSQLYIELLQDTKLLCLYLQCHNFLTMICLTDAPLFLSIFLLMLTKICKFCIHFSPSAGRVHKSCCPFQC